MEEHIRKFNELGISFEALPDWKKKRRQIVSSIITRDLHERDGFRMPSNVIRSNMKAQLYNLKAEEQEPILFDHFLTLCRGFNTPSIQCELDENVDELKFTVSSGADNSLLRWLNKCFPMVLNLYYLECCVARLHADGTRGPVVFTFCSVVAKYLRKTLYPALVQLEKLPRKNLLTLQRKCTEFNNMLEPLKNIALDVERFDYVGGELINVLFMAAQSDRNFQIAELLQKIISLALKRYYEVVFEWMSQCTLTFDLAHEFFVWDLSKTKCVKRTEFPKNQSDGTQFDNRFVIIPELCPEILKPISTQIIEVGKYLHIMQTQSGDLNVLPPQLHINIGEFRNRSISELRALIRNSHEQCSTNIMKHLLERFDVGNFALRLPHYFFGFQSAWIEKLAVMYENSNVANLTAAQLTPAVLHQLLDRALDDDWLQDDEFRKRVQLIVSPFYHIGNVPALELDLNWDASLNLVVPNHVLEVYRRLFRLTFLLHRTQHLLYRKRFFDFTFRPSRQELATLFLIIRFINSYHNFVFVTVVEAAYDTFVTKFSNVHNLDHLVEVQWNFLCRILGDACLDVDKKFTSAMTNLITLFCAYARNEMDLNSITQKAAPLISSIKKLFLKNRSFATLRNIFFGANFHSVGEADFEPLWMSLRHIEPIK